MWWPHLALLAGSSYIGWVTPRCMWWPHLALLVGSSYIGWVTPMYSVCRPMSRRDRVQKGSA